MPMQPYTITKRGTRLIQQTGQLPILQAGFTAQSESLGGIISNKGNGKDATRHTFSKSATQARIGIYREIRPGGYQYSQEGVIANGYPLHFANLDSGMASRVDSKAIAKLYDKLRGSLDVSIDLIQHQQVRKMVVGRAERSIAHLIHTVRKMRHAPSRVASNLWLEYTYGVKPLMSSIQGVMKEAVNPQEGLVQIRVRASEQQNHDFERTNGQINLAKDRYREVHSRRVEYYAAYNPNNATLLSQLGRITSLNPISIAYELIPYSFVLDWFYDLGGYLRMYESATLYNSAFVKGWVCRTSRLSSSASTDYLGRDASSPASYVFELRQKGFQESKTYDRSPLTATPFPPLPRFKADVGASRLLSAVALARGMVPRSLDFKKDFWKEKSFKAHISRF